MYKRRVPLCWYTTKRQGCLELEPTMGAGLEGLQPTMGAGLVTAEAIGTLTIFLHLLFFAQPATDPSEVLWKVVVHPILCKNRDVSSNAIFN